MNLRNLAFLLLFFQFFTIQAQERNEKISALKIAFITQELSLTVEEAEKFWPIYNIYDQERFSLHKETKKLLLESKNLTEMSAKEAEILLQKFDKIEDDLMQNRKKSEASLLPILGAKKVLMLKSAEEQFKRRLLRQFREGRKEFPKHTTPKN